MALMAHYSDQQEVLICRACRSSEATLEDQGLIHVTGADRVFTQTRIRINCRKCGESSAFLFGGAVVSLREADGAPEARQCWARPTLARWLPQLNPLFTWLGG